ncbi:MAG: hypothetical protein U0175_00310 [Caldilineaceae bacterium]
MFLLIGIAQSVSGFSPTTQVFYIPIPEDQAFTTFRAINPPLVSGNIVDYISIVPARTDTYVYYDQWENGYDSDISNPANLYSTSNPGGTQIWGDGIAANGCPPNINWVTITCTNANDRLTAGAAIILSSVVSYTSAGLAVIDFDGRDKVAATGPIAVTRTGWPTTPGTVLASSTEVLPTQNWGTDYRVPVGENTPTGATPATSLYSYSSIAIMASQNGTSVTIDLDGSGVISSPFSITLNEGESYAVTGGVMEGASVQASAPVQVNLMAGALGSAIRMDWYALYPMSLWSNVYYNPVGTINSAPTSLFFYNPGPSSMTVNCNYQGSTASRTIAANDTLSVTVPADSGARCASNTGYPFFAIATVDTDADNVSSDWGFTLVPDTLLSAQLFVGLGIGKDPNSSSSENGSPIWVTLSCASPITTSYVYVDWNNDGTPDRADLNGDGDTLDTINGISENSSNQGMLVQLYQSVRLYDSVDIGDNDQTGARIYTLTGANGSGSPGCDITGAWGQDPNVASQGSPGLDLGTTMPPFPLLSGGKGTLQITDLDGDNVAGPNEILEYTIVAQNVSLVAINNVIISDTVPLSTTYVAGSTAIITPTGPTTTTVADNIVGTAFPLDNGGINIGNLAAGAERKVVFRVKIDPGLQVCNLAISNKATVKSSFGFETPSSSTPLCKPTIRKSANANSLLAGTQLTYTLAYTIVGSSSYKNMLISDTLPTGASYVTGSASLTPSLISGNLLQWSLGTLTPTVINTITYRALISTTIVTGTQLVNRVTLTDVFGSQDGSQVTTTIWSPVHDLSISKNDNVISYTAGLPITYTIVARNLGPSDAINIIISDTKPAQIGSWTWNCSTQSGGASGCDGIVNSSLNFSDSIALPTGAAITYTVVATTTSSANTVLTNTASISATIASTDPVPGNNSATDSDNNSLLSDLSISKNDNVTSYTAGLPITYTIVARNLGPSDASNILISDIKPIQIGTWTWNCTAQSVGASGCSGSLNSGTDFSNIVTLPAGGAITYTVIATTTSSASTLLTNTAIISASVGTNDPVSGNNSATDSDSNNLLADLSISKSDNVTGYIAGLPITYTIVARNLGPSDNNSVIVSDTKPSQISNWTWNCTTQSAGTSGCDGVVNSAGNFTDTLILPAGAAITYTVIATTSVSAITSLTNTANISTTAGISDPVPSNNSAIDIDTLNRLVDLSLDKSDSADPSGASATLTYTLLISNTGPSNATGVLVTDTLPLSVTFVSANPSQSSGPTPLVWNLGTVTVNTTSRITVVVTISPSFTGTITNTAVVSSTILDSNPSNNQDSEPTTVFVQADLSISKNDNVTSYTAGLPLTYTIVARNLGPATASSVIVSDTKPVQINQWTWNCTTQSGGASGCNGMVNSTANFSDTISLPAGGAITYTVIATTTASALNSLTNTVIITPASAIYDPVLTNNSSTDNDSANPLSDLRVTKSDTLDPIAAGRTLTYTIMITNAGPSDAQNVVISDTLPAGLSFVSATAGCSFNANILTCAVGTIAQNTTTTITVVVTVNSDVARHNRNHLLASASFSTQYVLVVWKPPPIDST